MNESGGFGTKWVKSKMKQIWNATRETNENIPVFLSGTWYMNHIIEELRKILPKKYLIDIEEAFDKRNQLRSRDTSDDTNVIKVLMETMRKTHRMIEMIPPQTRKESELTVRNRRGDPRHSRCLSLSSSSLILIFFDFLTICAGHTRSKRESTCDHRNDICRTQKHKRDVIFDGISFVIDFQDKQDQDPRIGDEDDHGEHSFFFQTDRKRRHFFFDR
jgi:hypothetical protein